MADVTEQLPSSRLDLTQFGQRGFQFLGAGGDLDLQAGAQLGLLFAPRREFRRHVVHAGPKVRELSKSAFRHAVVQIALFEGLGAVRHRRKRSAKRPDEIDGQYDRHQAQRARSRPTQEFDPLQIEVGRFSGSLENLSLVADALVEHLSQIATRALVEDGFDRGPRRRHVLSRAATIDLGDGLPQGDHALGEQLQRIVPFRTFARLDAHRPVHLFGPCAEVLQANDRIGHAQPQHLAVTLRVGSPDQGAKRPGAEPLFRRRKFPERAL